MARPDRDFESIVPDFDFGADSSNSQFRTGFFTSFDTATLRLQLNNFSTAINKPTTLPISSSLLQFLSFDFQFLLFLASISSSSLRRTVVVTVLQFALLLFLTFGKSWYWTIGNLMF